MKPIAAVWQRYLRRGGARCGRAVRPLRRYRYRPCLERLESRTLLTGLVSALNFTAVQTAHAAGFLAAPNDFDLFTLHLNAGDRIDVAVSAQSAGSGLQSVLRIFDHAGNPVAQDDQEGGDPQITFQAAVADDYRIGVSSAGDDAYSPDALNSGNGGATTGRYTLDVRLNAAAPLQAGLAGSSFRLTSAETAAWGEAATVSFTVENRGGLPADPTAGVQLLLSDDPAFAATSHLYAFAPVYALAGLAQGQPFVSGPLMVTLPDRATAQAAGFASSGPVYVGLRISDATPGSSAVDTSGVHRGEDWQTLTIVTPAAAGVTDLSTVDAGLNTRVRGTLSASAPTATYSFTVTAAQGGGRFTAAVAATSGTVVPRLMLVSSDFRVLIQSDNGSIVEHLQPGTYNLVVTARSGAGGYQLISGFVSADSPMVPLGVGDGPYSVAVADLNGDGIPDLVTANAGANTVSVLLGNGDGTFRPGPTYPVGTYPHSVAVADVNGDGKPDLVVANKNSSTVSVLLGNGDGSFLPQPSFDVGANPESAVVADVNGDGKPDLVVTNYGAKTVGVFLGNGDGTFANQRTFAVGAAPASVAVADVNGDGKPDLVVANFGISGHFGNTVSVLLGNGDGTFQPQHTLSVGGLPVAVVVADVNGDGKPDLVVANFDDNTLSVLPGNGDGSFQPQQVIAVGTSPQALTVADVNGDGKLDLVVANNSDNTVSVLLGNGDGSFQPQQTVAVGGGPVAVAVADVNGDGKPDLVAANFNDSTVSVLLGNGDGSFQPQPTFRVGTYPQSAAVADVNGDGKLDLVVANYGDNTVSVLLGNDDGTFQSQPPCKVGSEPISVAVADVNGDGRPDLITANSGTNTVSVLLGNGDGSFQPQRTVAVGRSPSSVAVADVNGDGIPDLIVTDLGDNTVRVLLGYGDGFFQPPRPFGVGKSPRSVVVADVNGDGKPDLVVADTGDDKVGVLLGNGDGSFQPQRTFAVGTSPQAVVVADVNGDGKPDLVVANFGDDKVGVLLGNGDGSFQEQQTFAVGAGPQAVAVADINGDGKPDLIVANYTDYTVSTLLGNGDGTFQTQQTLPVGAEPSSVVVADVNGDGRPDLVLANRFDNTVSVLLGNGDATFTATTPERKLNIRNTPQLADLNGDQTPDSVILDRSGNILFRQGLAGAGNSFASPVPLNDTLIDPRTNLPQVRAARDLTLLHTATGEAVATADAIPDPTLASPTNPFVYTVSLYRVAGDGTHSRALAFQTTLLPTRIAAADLTGNGLDDLVVADSLDNRVQVALQQADGTFGSPLTLPVGLAPSDIALVDVDGDGRKDIVVTNQASGTVTVLFNDPTHSFSRVATFRAGAGWSGITQGSAGPTVTSLDQSVSLAAGNLTGTGRNDLVVVNRGDHSFTVLQNDGTGYGDPQAALTTSTSFGVNLPSQAGPVVIGDFNHDGKPDVAILMEDTSQLWVFLNRGDGTFLPPIVNAAGTFGAPSGLAFVPGTNGQPDRFLVGNAFGDILTLPGDGTGRFSVERGNLDSVPLAVGRTRDGRAFAIVADQNRDQLLIYYRNPGSNDFAPPQAIDSHNLPLLAPGAVALADLGDGHGKTRRYLIVANRLGNDVLVYPVLANGTFGAPTSYPVGVAPVAVTVVNGLNRHGVADLAVVNQGSNDVSLLFGAIDPRTKLWTATAGPRLKSGGTGPVAVAVRASGSGHGPDLLVTNSDGKVVLLPGIGTGGQGTGFFRDTSPETVNAGIPIIQAAQTPGGLVLVGADGSLREQTGAGFTTLVNEGVAAVAAFGGFLVAGLDDGTVELLSGDGTVLASATTGFDEGLSALEALRDGDVLDVYATAPGDSVPVIVPLSSPLLPVVLGSSGGSAGGAAGGAGTGTTNPVELSSGPAVAQTITVPSGGAPLLVTALVPGGLEDAAIADAGSANAADGPTITAVPAAAAAADADAVGEAAAAEGGTPSPGRFPLATTEALRQWLLDQSIKDKSGVPRAPDPAPPPPQTPALPEAVREDAPVGPLLELAVAVPATVGRPEPAPAGIVASSRGVLFWLLGAVLGASSGRSQRNRSEDRAAHPAAGLPVRGFRRE